MKEFAPDYQRKENGWIIFPELHDAKIRKDLFPPQCMEHPAKAPIGLYESIISYVSKKNETLMDIMSGSGTIMVGALMDRNIICLELEASYYNSLFESRDAIQPRTNSNITIITGDCRKVLPIPVNHIIFSPPYAQIMKMKVAKQDSTRQLAGTYKDSIGNYSESPNNVGNLSKFMYNQAMESIYKLCYESIIPPGTLTVILKDYMKQGSRVYLSDWLIRTCIKTGFEVMDWFKRYAPGTGFLKLWRSRGYETVEDEDIVIFRRLR